MVGCTSGILEAQHIPEVVLVTDAVGVREAGTNDGEAAVEHKKFHVNIQLSIKSNDSRSRSADETPRAQKKIS